jgi:hypothetical protein
LVKDYGKKKYYKPEEVKKANTKVDYSELIEPDFVCWGMSIFSSHSEFDNYHESAGEACDYTEMKTEMLQGLSAPNAESWLEITDMDVSWLEIGDVSDGAIEGLGEFFSSIFDGL